MAKKKDTKETAAQVDAFVLQHYRTAVKVEQCAKSWVKDARLLGNVRAEDIAAMCEHYRAMCEMIEPLAPIFAADGIRFWVCPAGCDDSVTWDDEGIATCQNCFRSSKR
jgi:hypothetical protein